MRSRQKILHRISMSLRTSKTDDFFFSLSGEKTLSPFPNSAEGALAVLST